MKCNREKRGATLVELAVALPVILLVIYGIIYLGLTLTVQGILQNATAKALEEAVSLPEFQEPPPEAGCASLDPSQTSKFCQGIDKVKQTLLSLPFSTLISSSPDSGFAYITVSDNNPEIIFPEGITTQSDWDESLQTIPIEIKVTAHIKPFLPWMDPVDLTVSHAGYYEVSKVSGYPILVDCNGVPQGHPDYKKLPCDCSQYPNSVWDPESLTCYTCPPDTSAVLDANHREDSQTPKGCYCPTHEYCQNTYGQGAQVLWNINDTNYCWCGCYSKAGWTYANGSDVSGGCVCEDVPPPYDPDGPGGQAEHQFVRRQIVTSQSGNSDICECDPPVTIDECNAWFPEAANNNMLIVTQDKCSCTCAPCPNWDIMSRTGDLENGCTCECKNKGNYDSAKGECVCNPDTCVAPLIPDPNDCSQCICDPNTCPNGGIPEPPACTCRCPCSDPDNPNVCIPCPEKGGTG